jgi:hypothetical protein
MASLTEVYEGGNEAGHRRLYAGVALFAVGAAFIVAGIVVAGTGVGSRFGLDMFEARKVAGIIGGLGLPAVLLGTMTVIPRTARKLRVGAVIGAAISLVGVVLFRRSYPVDWVTGSGNTEMTIVVSAVYFLGTLIATWCLFVAVANFKARNDPGGTVKLEITKQGETRVVEVSNDNLRGRLGGIGLLGGTPDGDVETQTNRGGGTDHSGSGAGSRADRSRTDGGATTDEAEVLTDGPSEPLGDTYCGNCSRFQYVRTDGDIEPYCGYHGELMDDMDACEEWTPNRSA